LEGWLERGSKEDKEMKGREGEEKEGRNNLG